MKITVNLHLKDYIVRVLCEPTDGPRYEVERVAEQIRGVALNLPDVDNATLEGKMSGDSVRVRISLMIHAHECSVRAAYAYLVEYVKQFPESRFAEFSTDELAALAVELRGNRQRLLNDLDAGLMADDEDTEKAAEKDIARLNEMLRVLDAEIGRRRTVRV